MRPVSSIHSQGIWKLLYLLLALSLVFSALFTLLSNLHTQSGSWNDSKALNKHTKLLNILVLHMLACPGVLASFSKPGPMAPLDCSQMMRLLIQGSSDFGSCKKLLWVHLFFALASVENALALNVHPPVMIAPHLAISQMPLLLKCLHMRLTLPLLSINWWTPFVFEHLILSVP